MSNHTVKLHVVGMTCGGCVASVERALRKVPGVVDAVVNLTTEAATVTVENPPASVQELIAAVQSVGYDAERAREAGRDLSVLDASQANKLRQQRQAVVQAIGLALPIIALEWFGPRLQSTQPGAHVWWRVVQALLSTMLMCSSAGGPILVGGLRAIWHRSANMDLLVTLGTATAYVSSMVAVFQVDRPVFHFHAIAMILGFINVGKYFELRARREASAATAALARRMPTVAMRLRDGQIEMVSVDAVVVGDRLRVTQDGTIPVDGRIIDGSAAVDLAAITGESVPMDQKTGDSVPAGGIVREGDLTIEAVRVGAESAVGAILRAVEQAQASKTRAQKLADRVAGVFVPIIVLLAILTFAGWTTLGYGVADGLRAAVAVLIISCPCAMGLATPTAVLVATGEAALRGLLVRDVAALETAGQADVVVFDKTGTLTTGEPIVADLHAAPDGPLDDENALLRLAASAEQFSQHPFAVAITAAAAARGLDLFVPSDYRNEPGLGIAATVDRRKVLVGSPRFLRESGIDDSHDDEIPRTSVSLVFIAVDGEFAGAIGLADRVRPDAADAVRKLRELGLRIAMVSGDRAATANAIASQLAIDDVVSEAMPTDKQLDVQRRRDAGEKVIFVGDGVNDAPALTTADVGIAFAAGTDVARAAADLTLLGNDLTRIPEAVVLARRTLHIIKQNLFWAFFYNVAAIPLAATGRINPGLAAAAMMISSITVVLNSLRLRRTRSVDNNLPTIDPRHDPTTA